MAIDAAPSDVAVRPRSEQTVLERDELEAVVLVLRRAEIQDLRRAAGSTVAA